MPKSLRQCSACGELLGFPTQPRWPVKPSGAGTITGLWRWPVFLPLLTSIMEGLTPFAQRPHKAQSHSCLSYAPGTVSRSREFAVERVRERKGQMGKKEAGRRR